MQVSIWERESFFRHKDVIIVGSGFVGLWTALELKKRKPSWKISIIDRGIIPTGASTRNAGFSCFGSLTELIADTSRMGEEKMLELVKMRYDGLKKIRKYFKPAQIDFFELGGYELFSENGSYDLEKLETDIKRINKLLKPVLKEGKIYRKANKRIKEFGLNGVRAIVENPIEGQMHAGKLTLQLLKTALKKGIEYLPGVELKSFERAGKNIILHTQLTELTTDNLVLCTNAFTKSLLPEINVYPARGQILVTSEITDLKIKGTFHYEEGYYYFRNLGNRVLLGGARNKYFEEENTPVIETSENIQKELERFLKEVILSQDQNYSIDYRWSGIMGMGEEKLPIISEVQPKVYCAVRMSGMGVALAPVVAERVSDVILG